MSTTLEELRERAHKLGLDVAMIDYHFRVSSKKIPSSIELDLISEVEIFLQGVEIGRMLFLPVEAKDK